MKTPQSVASTIRELLHKWEIVLDRAPNYCLHSVTIESCHLVRQSRKEPNCHAKFERIFYCSPLRRLPYQCTCMNYRLKVGMSYDKNANFTLTIQTWQYREEPWIYTHLQNKWDTPVYDSLPMNWNLFALLSTPPLPLPSFHYSLKIVTIIILALSGTKNIYCPLGQVTKTYICLVLVYVISAMVERLVYSIKNLSSPFSRKENIICQRKP